MLYCNHCNKYIEQNGPIAYQVGDICPNCGQSRLIDKPEEKTEGMNINGSGNAIDMHQTHQNISNDNSQHHDSHNDYSQHYDQRGQVNVHGGNYQVNNVAAQTTQVDVTQKNEERYRAGRNL